MKPQKTPMSTLLEQEGNIDKSYPLRSLIGSILYVAQGTR